jgi:predicted Fe-Mo cluster-binding NifX family protein
MKIAISTDGNFVSAHFGRCPNFTIVEIENGKLVKREIIDNPGHHPGYLPQFLSQHGVNCIIAGLFAEQAIQTVIGADGSIDEVIDKIIAGTLQGGENICKPGLGKGYGVAKTEHQHGEGCRKEVQGT